MTTDRDPQVGALLDLLEPVPPRADFWAELEDRLRSEPALAVVLPPVPGGVQRRRRLVIGLAAAVAAIAAVAGGLAVRDDGRERNETVPPVQPGPDDVQPAPNHTTETTIDPASAQGQALATADAWILAASGADVERSAWDLLGPQSRESIGDEAALDALLAQDGQRGQWAQYQQGPDRHFAVAQIGATSVFLVVLTVDSEADAVAPLALLVRHEAEAPSTVEPFVPGPALDLIGLPPQGTLAPDTDVPLALADDPDATSVAVLIDGIQAPEGWLVRDGRGKVIGVQKMPKLEPGPHWIGVAEVLPDGTLTADARAFYVGNTAEG